MKFQGRRFPNEGPVTKVPCDDSMEKALRQRFNHARGESKAAARVC
jgi:hypothetical protein